MIMDTLDEKILSHIFNLLGPKEWASLAEVHPDWKNQLCNSWKKITTIKNLSRYSYAPLLTTEEAQIIIANIAPYIKSLQWTFSGSSVIMLGPYMYNVQTPNAANVIKILCEVSTNITHMNFLSTDVNTEQLNKLLKSNKQLEKLCLSECYTELKTLFNEDSPSTSAKEFSYFSHMANGSNFWSQYFPKLEKLHCTLNPKYFSDVDNIMKEELPHLTHLKSLTLRLDPKRGYGYHSKPFTPLESLSLINMFTELEELRIILGFLNKFADHHILAIKKTCKKLRIVELQNFRFNKRAIKTVMSLAKLQSLIVDSIQVLDVKKFPVMMNLTSCEISFSIDNTVYLEDLCRAVEAMPAIQELKINDSEIDISRLSLACKVIDIAFSRNKSVIICQQSFNQKETMYILNNTIEHPITLIMSKSNIENRLFEEITDYIGKNLKRFITQVNNKILRVK